MVFLVYIKYCTAFFYTESARIKSLLTEVATLKTELATLKTELDAMKAKYPESGAHPANHCSAKVAPAPNAN